MPNHVKNRIELIGSDEEVKALIDAFSTTYPEKPRLTYDGRRICTTSEGEVGWLDEETNEFTQRDKEPVIGLPEGFVKENESEWTRFPDFDKVFKMPESLQIQIHSGIEQAIEKAVNVPFSDEPLLASMQKVSRERAKSPQDLTDEEYELFKIGVDNYRKYGHIYWYTWQIENWGTKWNAYSCEKESDNVYTFDTAWSCVPKILEEMSEKFPNVEIRYEYSDEDTGYNCGIMTFVSGTTIEVNILEGGSREAYELAFKLRPHYAEGFHLVDGNYEYKDEE